MRLRLAAVSASVTLSLFAAGCGGTAPDAGKSPASAAPPADAAAKRAAAQKGANALNAALFTGYYAKRGGMPLKEQGLAILVTMSIVDEKALTDPWGRPYQYDPNAAPMVFSLGPDGLPGTADDVKAE
jgi:hypothetical protein